MSTPATRPADSVLRDYLLGKPLSPDEVKHVEQWMDDDPDAKQVLAGINANDTVVNAFKPSDTDLPEHNLAMNGTSKPAEIGDYELGAELGQGGMGVVFAATNKHTRQQHAIKLITPAHAADPLIRERFLREARAGANIQHPNVVPTLHVGEDNGLLYVVMPLLKGETLAARLEREKSIPADELIRIACDIAAGLAAAHALGLVHRDIKPANVWLDADTGRARILDFGLVKPLEAKNDGLTETGAVMGTPNYMSPEQAEAMPVDAKSDLFSLGTLLYHAATGEVPFKGDSYIQVLIAIKSDTPRRPEKLNAKLHPRLAAVIRSLLEKEPMNRPASATEVIEELQGTATPPRSQCQQPRRRKYIAVVAACLLLVLGAAFAVYQIEFTTKEGTLVVEVDDKETDVRFKNGEIHIYGDDGKLKYFLKAGEHNAKLSPGPYTVKVIGADGVELETTEFTMTKNGEVVLRVTSKPKSDPITDTTDYDRKAAEWALSRGEMVKVNGDEKEIRSKTDLPSKRFDLTFVALDGNPDITDEGLANLKNCRFLTGLSMTSPRVTDKGIAHLRGCKKLTHLGLGGTTVGDEGVAVFKDCANLTSLHLGKTRVTDAGIARLKDHTELIYIELVQTKVSAAAVRDLAKALPRCKIEWDGGTIEPKK